MVTTRHKRILTWFRVNLVKSPHQNSQSQAERRKHKQRLRQWSNAVRCAKRKAFNFALRWSKTRFSVVCSCFGFATGRSHHSGIWTAFASWERSFFRNSTQSAVFCAWKQQLKRLLTSSRLQKRVRCVCVVWRRAAVVQERLHTANPRSGRQRSSFEGGGHILLDFSTFLKKWTLKLRYESNSKYLGRKTLS